MFILIYWLLPLQSEGLHWDGAGLRPGIFLQGGKRSETGDG